jgi:hypothetical protein
LLSFPGLDIAVQRGSGDLEGLANLRNRVSLIAVERLGNTESFAGEGFGSAAFPPSGSGRHKSCLGSLPNQVSLKLRKSAEDMKD